VVTRRNRCKVLAGTGRSGRRVLKAGLGNDGTVSEFRSDIPSAEPTKEPWDCMYDSPRSWTFCQQLTMRQDVCIVSAGLRENYALL
jgi:hypothetical protein